MDENKSILSIRKKLTKHSKLFSNKEKIRYLLNKNNGYLTTKEITKNKISRDYLTWLVDYGEIINVARGIYIDRKVKEDTYYTFQLRFPKTIFSHMSALSLYGLTSYPEIIQATCINNVFSNDFKKYDIFYVKKEWYELGATEIIDKMGFSIKVYDLERSICDIIRSHSRLNESEVKKIIKKYLNLENKNIDALFSYADQMEIGKEVIKFLK